MTSISITSDTSDVSDKVGRDINVLYYSLDELTQFTRNKFNMIILLSDFIDIPIKLFNTLKIQPNVIVFKSIICTSSKLIYQNYTQICNRIEQMSSYKINNVYEYDTICIFDNSFQIIDTTNMCFKIFNNKILQLLDKYNKSISLKCKSEIRLSNVNDDNIYMSIEYTQINLFKEIRANKLIYFSSVMQYITYIRNIILIPHQNAEHILYIHDVNELKNVYGHMNMYINPTWDLQIYNILYHATMLKFSQNELLKTLLISTTNQQIVDTNVIGKLFGDTTKLYTNNIQGNILMSTRSALSQFIKNIS
jgi:predicted NAD-dependent protein-ADP-ribosyltransferase YbiA (DUF1768 family)